MNKAHLQYHWWKYALALALSLVLWCGVFRAMTQPKANEKCNVLFVGQNINAKALEIEIQQMLPELTNQALKQVKVTQLNLQGKEVLDVLQSRFYEYDVVIVSESCMPESMGAILEYRSLSQSFCEYFSNCMLYAEVWDDNAAVYGMEIKQGIGLFGEHYTGREKCYCFPSPQSESFGGLNGRGKDGDNAALLVMELLLGEKSIQEGAK